jgi:hypothetical protein
VRCYSPSGTPQTHWVRWGMPKLGQYKDILKTVVFLYENEDDALAGVNVGGTGFLVSIGSRRYPNEVRHTHVVTNWHVAVSGAPSCPVVRINAKSGKPKTIDYDPSQWVFVPGGPDVAVSPPIEWLDDVYDAIPFDGRSWLLTSEEEIKQEIGLWIMRGEKRTLPRFASVTSASLMRASNKGVQATRDAPSSQICTVEPDSLAAP